MYVPVSVVPRAGAVNVTAVADELSVTVIVEPAAMDSLMVAVMFTVAPALYEPSAVLDVNAVMVGAVKSATRDVEEELFDTLPAMSNSLTVNVFVVPLAAVDPIAVARAELLAVPREKLADVSPLLIDESVAASVPPRYSSALPPPAYVPSIVAVAVMFVFVLLR